MLREGTLRDITRQGLKGIEKAIDKSTNCLDQSAANLHKRLESLEGKIEEVFQKNDKDLETLKQQMNELQEYVQQQVSPSSSLTSNPGNRPPSSGTP